MDGLIIGFSCYSFSKVVFRPGDCYPSSGQCSRMRLTFDEETPTTGIVAVDKIDGSANYSTGFRLKLAPYGTCRQP